MALFLALVITSTNLEDDNLAFTAAAPIGFGNTTQGFDALREFYTVMDEKRKEKMKAEAQEFKALQSLAKVRGWAEPDAMTVSDLGSLRGFVEGKIAEEQAQTKQQELAIREMAAQREKTYAKSPLGKLLSERQELEQAGGATPDILKAYTDAIANETTGAKQMAIEDKRQQNRLKREEFMHANRQQLAELRNQFVLEAEARKAAVGGNPRFVLNDRDKMMMESELNFVEKWVDPDEAKAAFAEIEERYKARAIKPQASTVSGAVPKSEIADGATKARVPRITELQAPEGSEKVLIEKDGKQFRIPKHQLEEALKQGYTQPK